MPNINDVLGQLLGKIDSLAAAHDRMADQIEAQSLLQQAAATIKYMRLPVMRAAGANPFTLGGDTNSPSGQGPVGPDLGWTWHLRLMVITGLTAGATPDVVNVLAGQQRVIWQLNGNQFCQTWGRGEQIIFQGETLGAASVGTFAATGQIQVFGTYEQIAGERGGVLR